MTELERCAGCGGVIAVIGRRHLCSGALLQPKPAEGVKSTKRAVIEKRALATERKRDTVAPPPKPQIRTIDERIADCPVCAARRKKETRKKQRYRVKKTIPGQR